MTSAAGPAPALSWLCAEEVCLSCGQDISDALPNLNPSKKVKSLCEVICLSSLLSAEKTFSSYSLSLLSSFRLASRASCGVLTLGPESQCSSSNTFGMSDTFKMNTGLVEINCSNEDFSTKCAFASSFKM